MKKCICHFAGDHKFLSNFYEAPIIIDGTQYSTSEHYYQSMKTLKTKERREIIKASSPGLSKKLGSEATLREDWDKIKDEVMLKAIRAKFTQNEELAEKLKETEGWELQEGNTWGDTYWGVSLQSGQGQNKLGKILMQVRGELLNV